MTEPLIEIKDPSLISTGIPKGLPALTIPLWADGNNVIFQDTSVRKMPGRVAIGSKLSTLPSRGAAQLEQSAGTKYCFFGNAETIYQYTESGGIISLSTGFTGIQDETSSQDATAWSFAPWGDWILATNGIDSIQIDKLAGGGMAALTGTPPTRAEILIKIRNFVLALNTDLGNKYLEWCKEDDVEDWVNGAAGNLNLRELDSRIVSAAKLNEDVAVYGKDSMLRVYFDGYPYWFLPSKTLFGIGAVGKLATCQGKDGENYGYSAKGFWRTDGLEYEYLDDPYIRDWIGGNINKNQLSKVNCWHWGDRNSIVLSIPTGTNLEPTTDLIFNYQNKSWSFGDGGFTTGLPRDVFAYPIVTDSNGNLLFTDTGVDNNGGILSSFIQTRPLPGPSRYNYKSWDRIKFLLDEISGTGLCVEVAVSDSPNPDSLSFTLCTTPTDDMENIWLTVADSKFITLKFSTTAIGDDFKLSGMTVFGTLLGDDG